MSRTLRHRIAGIFIVLLCVFAVVGVRISRKVGSAVADDPAKTEGPANAPVTIVVFSDFQCPYCSQFAPVLKKVHEAFPKEVKIIFKHFPLNMHPSAVPAAEAAECAADQGKFWPYHDMLFENQEKWSQSEKPAPFFKEYADKLGLDAAKFDKCVSGKEKLELIKQNKAEGKKFMVSGTPTGLLNYKKYIVSMDEEGIKKTIEQELKKAKKS